jgi:class 3 adenylate cyclase
LVGCDGRCSQAAFGMSDLAAWLDAWGLGQLASLMAEQDIDIQVLGQLTEDDLRELGLTVGLRRRLIHAIEEGLRRPIKELALSGSGTLTSPPNLGAERRHLTILFSDLARSTELATQLDPEEVSIVLRTYQACCTAAIEGYGGQISRFIGDGILACFCYPQAHRTTPSAQSVLPSILPGTSRAFARCATSCRACASE